HYRRLKTFVLGRRRKDSNFIPAGDRYVDRLGVLRWCPIADWTHEEVFAVIAREQLPLPPIYDYPRGYAIGTGPWPARDAEGVTQEHRSPDQFASDCMQGFSECWQIDADIVRGAAEQLPIAREWMQAVGVR